jgi:3-oxoacyl-[acyl-carrier-protein] synthase-3
MSIKISAIEYFLPAKILDNQVLVEQFGFDPDFISEKLGIKERRQAGPEESCHTLAHEAAVKLFETQQIEPQAIDLLMVVTQNPDYKLPNVSALLQASLGLRNDVASFDLNQGCSGFVYSLAVAKGLMTTCGMTRGLIITCDPYSKVLAPQDRTTVPLFGDAAAAILLEHTAEKGIGEFDFGTDGTGAEALIVRPGGSKYPQPLPNEADNYLSMDGRAIYNFMMVRVPQSVERCLKANNLSFADVDLFVFHQASKYMVESLRKSMKIPEDRIVINMAEFGNTVSSSIPIALKAKLEDASCRGKCAFLCGFGVGLSWASVITYL